MWQCENLLELKVLGGIMSKSTFLVALVFVVSFGESLAARSPAPGPTQWDPSDEMTIYDVEKMHGPLDLTAPEVKVILPKSLQNMKLGDDLEIRAIATDNQRIKRVWCKFDRNGEGTPESDDAILIGNNEYSCSFKKIRGQPGSRDLMVVAEDISTNLETDEIKIKILKVNSPN
jgi:hypothetical protein